MSGFCGRSSVLRSFSPVQSNRWWATDSSGHRQSGHDASAFTPILLRCWLRSTWWHLKRKMVTCSFLEILLMLSLLFGAVMKAKTLLLLLLSSQDLIQISFFLCLIICFAVFMVVETFCWWHFAPCLASSSAFSLPWILLCPGIHWRVTLTWCVVMRLLIASDKFLITGSLSFKFSRAWSTDLASEKTTKSVLVSGDCS